MLSTIRTLVVAALLVALSANVFAQDRRSLNHFLMKLEQAVDRIQADWDEMEASLDDRVPDLIDRIERRINELPQRVEDELEPAYAAVRTQAERAAMLLQGWEEGVAAARDGMVERAFRVRLLLMDLAGVEPPSPTSRDGRQLREETAHAVDAVIDAQRTAMRAQLAHVQASATAAESRLDELRRSCSLLAAAMRRTLHTARRRMIATRASLQAAMARGVTMARNAAEEWRREVRDQFDADGEVPPVAEIDDFLDRHAVPADAREGASRLADVLQRLTTLSMDATRHLRDAADPVAAALAVQVNAFAGLLEPGTGNAAPGEAHAALLTDAQATLAELEGQLEDE